LGALVNTAYNNDSIFHCTDNSFACAQSNVRANASAGAKGIGAQLFADLQNQMPILQGLQARLATASSPKDLADIQAQISARHAAIDSMAAQIGATAMINQAQLQVSSEQRVQKINLDTNSLMAAVPQ